MRTITAGMEAHIQGEQTSLVMCWHLIRRDGLTLYNTEHDQPLVIDGNTYKAETGFLRTNAAQSSDLAVDNMEAHGLLDTADITEDDLRAGLWDDARVRVFMVNWADLTMGKLWFPGDRIGRVTCTRGQFNAELFGLTKAYDNQLGELYSASCRYTLGDARCTKDLTAFTHTGTIEGVADDGQTLTDSARTEPGPAGGVDITDVTNADPCVITTDGAHGFAVDQIIVLAGIDGPAALNTVVRVKSVPSDTTFTLDLDTSDTEAFPAYTSGGTATPLNDWGYFGGGVITFTSGANDGLSMEILAYTPGQLVLALPMPFEVEIGDGYTIVAGCNKTHTVCKVTFDNIINFGAEPFLPGTDKMSEVGRRQ